MNKKIILIILIITLLSGLIYISYLEVIKRNPYFDHLPQSDKNVILSATPEDTAKLFFESEHEKKLELHFALMSERYFWLIFSKTGQRHPPIFKSLLLGISPRYRNTVAKSLYGFNSEGLPCWDTELEEISEINTTDVTYKPIIGATGEPTPYMIGVSFVLKKGTFGCLESAPPSRNITLFVHVSKSPPYNSFLVDGIGTSP